MMNYARCLGSKGFDSPPFCLTFSCYNIPNTLFLSFASHPQRQSHEYHAASFFIPISSFPSLPEGFYLISSSSSKSSLLFYLSIIGIAAKCLIYSLAILYSRYYLILTTQQSRIHSQPISIQQTIIF